MVTSFAVIGASRGIGLAFVKKLAFLPDTVVFAVVRNGRTSAHLNAAVKDLNNVHVLDADVTDHVSLEHASKRAAEITGGRLDVLIHNAAKMDRETFYRGFDHFENTEQMDGDCIEAFKVNALGVIHSIQAFLPLLRAGPTKKIAVIGTEGAMAEAVRMTGNIDMLAYCMTKSAAYLATTKWALKLAPEGFAVFTVSPGLVDTTDTVGENGDPEGRAHLEGIVEAWKAKGFTVKLQTPEEAVELVVQRINDASVEQNGEFLSSPRPQK